MTDLPRIYVLQTPKTVQLGVGRDAIEVGDVILPHERQSEDGSTSPKLGLIEFEALDMFPDLKPKEAVARAPGRMTIIEATVPQMYRPNQMIEQTKKEEQEEQARIATMVAAMNPEQKAKYVAHLKAQERASLEAAEKEAIKLRSDLLNIKKMIVKCETMLAKYEMSAENRIDLETKLDHWVGILNKKVQGPPTAMEKFFERKRLEERMQVFHVNKGLRDVFQLFWYLVLPYCISDENDQNYLTKKGYIKFNSNLYIALTGTRDKEKVLRHALMNWQEDTREPVLKSRAEREREGRTKPTGPRKGRALSLLSSAKIIEQLAEEKVRYLEDNR